MKNDILTSQDYLTFGARLKTAREALDISPKDAAQKLFLNEKIIHQLEEDVVTSELPATFLRGYLRAYAKFLQIPPQDIELALANIETPTTHLQPIVATPLPELTSGHYFMQIFTYAIILTLIGLVGGWWYNHNKTTNLALEHNSMPALNSTPKVVATLTPPSNFAGNSNVVAVSNEASKAGNPSTPSAAVPPKQAQPLSTASNNTNNNDNNDDDDDNTD